jgi:hypothetical protein
MFVFDNKALTSRVSTQETRSESYRGTQRDGTTKSVADADIEFPHARRTRRCSFGMVRFCLDLCGPTKQAAEKRFV